ncbi:aminotransferase class III-fold pyridoxal phosphate-dependent enzyme [Halomicrococcus sp. NG-SE-24]|uniref:aminotransferase class III-fold pyridoxal phosphate-dependent enzyme n=1 Tax=Halomicrococcus sp. NG-SE-24 TaxID=3436928 RepID=UPI003D95AEAA
MDDKRRVPTDERPLERSQELLHRATDVIPGGSQTQSKGPSNWVRGVAPTHVERGEGSHVWDVDGNEYVDYTMALGPVILGYDYPVVTDAVEAQLHDGTTFSMPHPLQVEVAELFTDIVPCAEMVRFAKNGNDVTTLAAKIARAYTGRDVVATQGYHGWPDVWTGATEMERGVPASTADLTATFEYNDVESLKRIFEAHPDDVAAVVTTPVNLHPPEDDFLQRVRELTSEHGALLVFDEVLTGFRFALGGAQEFFDVTPDLGCFAKGMANGFPISALAGREDVMRTLEDDDVFFSTTYAGEAMSLAATKACIDVIRKKDVTDRIAVRGRTLRDGYNDLAVEYGLADRTSATGYPWRFAVRFHDEDGEVDTAAKSLFMQECMDRGVLFSGTHLPSYSHTTDDVAYTLDVYETALAELADAVEDDEVTDRLRGDPVGATLRQRTGERD